MCLLVDPVIETLAIPRQDQTGKNMEVPIELPCYFNSVELHAHRCEAQSVTTLGTVQSSKGSADRKSSPSPRIRILDSTLALSQSCSLPQSFHMSS